MNYCIVKIHNRKKEVIERNMNLPFAKAILEDYHSLEKGRINSIISPICTLYNSTGQGSFVVDSPNGVIQYQIESEFNQINLN